MPVCDEFRPVQMGPPLPPASLVNLSSGEHSSEATEEEGKGASSAPRQRELLRNFPDDDDDDAPSVVELVCHSRVTTRSGAASLKQPKRSAMKKGRTAVLPLGSTLPSPPASQVVPTACSPAPKSAAPTAPAKPPLLGLKRNYVFYD